MSRRAPPLHPDDLKLWARVTATVRPRPGMASPAIPETPPVVKPAEPIAAMRLGPAPVAKPQKAKVVRPPDDIEPNRKRGIVRDRPEARIDLHGMDYDTARAVLQGFVLRAVDDGYRACLVITGKGSRGEGVLRRAVPEWLASLPLRAVVAGVSEAARHHGGAGALYVALKRRS
jgi:DNA-nicking Smr family endonuclease